MTLSTALFIFAAQLLAYLVKGLIGFGNPLISAPILSMGLDNVVITPGTLLLDCPVNAWITWKNRHSFQWRKILPLLAANFCGVIPGTLLLRFSMPWVIKTVLGVVVVLLGLEMATRSLRPVKPDRKDRPWGWRCPRSPACARASSASTCSSWPTSSEQPEITASSRGACAFSSLGRMRCG